MGHQRGVSIHMGELIVPLELLVIESLPYDVVIGLSTMIKLRALPDYYRMVLKVHFEGESEILNYEYEREAGFTYEDEFTSDDVGESNKDDESEVLVLMLSNGKLTPRIAKKNN